MMFVNDKMQKWIITCTDRNSAKGGAEEGSNRSQGNTAKKVATGEKTKTANGESGFKSASADYVPASVSHFCTHFFFVYTQLNKITPSFFVFLAKWDNFSISTVLYSVDFIHFCTSGRIWFRKTQPTPKTTWERTL